MDKPTWFNKKNPIILHFYVTLTFFISISQTPFFSPSAHFQSIILPNVSKIRDHLRANVKFCWYGILWFVVVQSLNHVWLCDPLDCSMPGFSVLHYLPKFAQTHVHWVGDSIQPSHPLSPPSPALNLSPHQSLFQWVDFSHQVAKV